MTSNFWEYFLSSYECLLVLMVTAITCSIIGTFLVLRRLSMVSDAISHSVLLGIVIAFFITKNISSPLLIVGAALFGVITVFSIEALSSTGLVKNDDAVGIIFPLFFALAVILITKYARNVHLDTDIVLMGEVIMTPLHRVNFMGISMPKALYRMSELLVLNLLFVVIFFKELKITTFDHEFATIAGFSSTILFYLLMTLCSLTSVVAFDAVGAILVVSFLITPAASAYMVTKDLKKMIFVSCIYAFINSILGYTIAMIFNVSMSGMTATIAGVTFFITFLFNREGLITSIIVRINNRKIFRNELMIMHIGNHMNTKEEKDELGITTMNNHLVWSREEVDRRIKLLIEEGNVYIDEEFNMYRLTEKGINFYNSLKTEYGIH